MASYDFIISSNPISENSFFSEASIEELKVFILLSERAGLIDSDEASSLLNISEPRLNAALMFWESAGVISVRDKNNTGIYGNALTKEFPERYIPGEIEEESSKNIAETIRNHGLANLFDELAEMGGKLLTPREISCLSAYVSQYKISEEYILTLAAHLTEKDEFTASRLNLKLKGLVEKEILTPEELNAYLISSEENSKDLAEYRKVFGIYNRKLTKSEKNYINKWSREYAFGTEIVGMAYDISIANISKLSFAYIDKLLEDWHKAGCKTLSECETQYEVSKVNHIKELEEKEARPQPQRRAKKAPTPRFGNFDPEEAVRLALERTYSNIPTEDEN